MCNQCCVVTHARLMQPRALAARVSNARAFLAIAIGVHLEAALHVSHNDARCAPFIWLRAAWARAFCLSLLVFFLSFASFSLSLSRRVQLSLRGSLALFAGSLPPGFSLYFSVSLSAPLLISLRLSQEHITSLKWIHTK